MTGATEGWCVRGVTNTGAAGVVGTTGAVVVAVTGAVVVGVTGLDVLGVMKAGAVTRARTVVFTAGFVVGLPFTIVVVIKYVHRRMEKETRARKTSE